MNLRTPPCLPALVLLSLAAPLTAQAPELWNAQRPLGQDQAPGTAWFGVGFLAADQHGPSATFVDSLGVGNAILGNGLLVEGGYRSGAWDLAAEALEIRRPTGEVNLSLYRGHFTWRSDGVDGWRVGLEQEPLVWGYGLNGGYLLGEADRPFPRFRVESPMTDLHLFHVPLGTWGFQMLVGRLENDRTLSPLLQDPLSKQQMTDSSGDPQGPSLNGYRVQAQFGASLEFYMNYLNLWGGTINGRALTQGYGVGDYLTAMFGLKDTLAEANAKADGSGYAAYKNKAISASNADLGFRLRLRRLETQLGAQSVFVYLSRGSKNIWWTPGTFFGNPIRYGWDDVHADGRRLVEGRFTQIWNTTNRYAIPNLTSPNDTLGLLMAWPRLRLGLEYLDTVNDANTGVRSFGHYIYTSGFYYHGDPLGNAVAGEARTTTARLEADLLPRLATTTILHVGNSPFRDNLALWQGDHPGLEPEVDHFVGLQQEVKWRLTPVSSLDLGASWERHGAVANVPDTVGNGFRWYTNLSFRWPARP